MGGGVAARSGQDKTSLETTPLCHIHLLRHPAGCVGHYMSVKLENKAGPVPGEQFVFVMCMSVAGMCLLLRDCGSACECTIVCADIFHCVRVRLSASPDKAWHVLGLNQYLIIE